ncbi:MAG: immunoglobulin domain-containing protein [Verrucomicrobiota bacterium]
MNRQLTNVICFAALCCGVFINVNAATVLVDTFSYSDGSLTNVAGSRWANYSGAGDSPYVTNGVLNISGSLAPDVGTTLSGAPYSSGRLYARFKMKMRDLPITTGAYFALFKDTGTSLFKGRLWASTSGAAAGKFRLGIAAATGTAVTLASDLSTNVDYIVILRITNTTSLATFWVNPTSETDASTTSTDSSAVTVSQFAFRQATGEGYILLDDLVVGTVWEDVMLPVITSQPQGQTNVVGTTITLAVTNTGAQPLAYQWRKNGSDIADGANISGAKTNVLTISSAIIGNSGDYTVVISNLLGMVTSAVATVSITNAAVVPPSIDTPPQSLVAGISSNATFSVVATGTPVDYRWYFNSNLLADGGRISGSTTNQLFISSLALSDAGYYHMIVSNSVGMATSTVATLTVTAAPPVIVSVTPASQTSVSGSSASFTVNATSLVPASYQWYFGSTPLADGGNVSGSTTNVLTLNPVGSGDAGNYSVVVSNLAGVVTGGPVSLVVTTALVAPQISLQPVGQTNLVGSNVAFQVIATGSAPLSYQWLLFGTNLFGGANVLGTNLETLTLNSITLGSSGDYSVIVGNAAGSVTSYVASLLVTAAPPVIVSVTPASQTVSLSNSASFTVSATSASPVSYQWFFGSTALADGGSISGSATTTLTINPAVATNAGSYTVVVSNVAGSVTSGPVTLAVSAPPQITTQPLGLTNLVGSTVALQVVATGSSPLAYQWRLSGTNLFGGTYVLGTNLDTLTLSNATKASSGNYSIVITNGAGAITSSVVTLLFTNPVVPTQPYPMASGNYLENFNDVANWDNNFTFGIGASCWTSVAVNATGTIPDGKKTTTSTATFASGSSGGVQKGTSNIVLLATGSTDNTSADAIDLLLDFTGRDAGTLSFDWVVVFNSTGNRAASLRVYASPDGSTWTELTSAAVLNFVNNVAGSGSMTAIALPASFNGMPTTRIRFYFNNGTGGSTGSPTGSRPKIALDNIAVTSTVSVGTPPIVSDPQGSTNWPGSSVTFAVTAFGTAPLHYQWQSNGVNLSDGGQFSGATTNTLTITNLASFNSADYRVIVTNFFGSTNSAVATLLVTSPLPQITTEPKSQTNFLGSTAKFTVSASTLATGAPALQYQWQSNGVNLVAGGQFSGVNSNILTITNVSYGNAADYIVIVSNPSGSVTSSVATMSVSASGTFLLWDFNTTINYTNPEPTFGTGIASLAGLGTNGFLPAGGTAYDSGMPTNKYWGTSTYPPVGTSNKMAGVQFSANLAGLKNVGVSFYQRLTTTSSKYYRLQYTTNGTTFIDYPASSTYPAGAQIWDGPYTFSLAGFPGVRDNPNFAIRIVTEFESTANYGMTNNDKYVGLTASYGTSGTVSYDLVNFTADAITNANVPPTLSVLTNQSTVDDTAANVTVTVGGTGPLTVTAVSLNQNVIADGAISTPTANGSDWSFTITPSVGIDGVAPILVTVTDAVGDVSKTWFNLTVLPANLPPSITQLPVTNTLVSTPITIPFTIGDDAPVDQLGLSASSVNAALLPNANIIFGGSGSNRTVTLTPVTGAKGATPITITVTDAGGKTASTAFALVVTPDTNVILNEFFDYPDGVIVNTAPNFWRSHSGAFGQVDVTSGKLNMTDAKTEDINVRLIGAPYSTNSSTVLYSSFVVNFSILPTEGGAYLAHFKDDGTDASSGFGARVWASTINATPGSFRLGIANGDGGTNSTAQLPVDLQTNVNYTVVTRFVPATGIATLWVGPSSEASASVTADDVSNRPTQINNPINVTAYAFRQAVGGGTLTVDNLRVGLSFVSVNPAPAITTPPVDTQVTVGGTLNLSVVAAGDQPLTYQWYYNTNSALTLKTNTALSKSGITCGDAGKYSVVVANAYGSVTSLFATVTVNDTTLPVVVTHPTPSNSVALGSNVTLSVSTTGVLCGAPNTYQWYFNTNTPVANATNSTVTITNLGLNQAGYYLVAVSNVNGVVLSSNALVVVNYTVVTPKMTNFTGGQLGLGIQAEPNRAYWLESRTSLSLGSPWTLVEGSGVTNVNGAVILRDYAATNHLKFYRLGSATAP